MSKLEKLINELCPNGVEYKPIWTLTAWDKKFKEVARTKQEKVIDYKKYFLGSEQQQLASENGTIKILTTYQSNIFANEKDVEDYVTDGEIVCIPWGGNAIVQYYNGRFITGDNRIVTSLDTDVLSNKYLYYVLNNKLDEIASYYRGSGIKHPEMNKVLNMEIPVPPRPIQDEIVRILDNFTELTAELTAELQDRRKQYEYYKQYVFDNIQDKEIKYITDIALVKARVGWQRLTTKEYLPEGECYLITGTDFVSGSINYNSCVYVTKERYEMDENIIPHKNDILITKDGTLGKVAFLNSEPDKPTTLNSGVFRIKITDSNVSPRYMYHYFTSKYFTDFVESVKTGSTIPHLTQEKLVKLDIPLPSLNEQERIVAILDKFDKYCNDISEGLPAEIETRQKQYEYYRDKLLTFKRVNN